MGTRGNESGNGQEREGMTTGSEWGWAGMRAGTAGNESRSGSERVRMGGNDSGNRWNESRDRNRNRAGAEGTGNTGVGHRIM